MAPYRRFKKTRRTFRGKKAATGSRIRRVVMSLAETKAYEQTGINMTDGTVNGAAKALATYTFGSFLNNIVVGTGVNNRIGMKIFVKYIDLSINFEMDSDILTNGQNCRYGILWNKRTAGVIASAANVFNSGGAKSTTSQVDALPLWSNKPQYTILEDRIHSVFNTTQNAAGTAATQTPQGVIQFRVPINKVVHYNAGVTPSNQTAANIVDNDINWFIAAWDVNCCIPRMAYRVCFKDI